MKSRPVRISEHKIFREMTIFQEYFNAKKNKQK